MVYYGYNLKDKPKLKWKLAEALADGLELPIETKNKVYRNDGRSPYIEVDGDYVRIRRITWLSKEEQETLQATADNILSLLLDPVLKPINKKKAIKEVNKIISKM